MNLFLLSFQFRIRVALSAMLICTVSLAACQGPKTLAKRSEKSYQASDYQMAVEYAVQALKAKPDLDRAIEALNVAYPAAVRSFESQIEQLKASSATFRDVRTLDQRKQIVNIYQSLISMNDEVQNLPPVSGKKTGIGFSHQVKTYYDFLADARERMDNATSDAAEMHYQEGLRLMASGGIDNNKAAAKEFKVSQQFVANYKDTGVKYEEARKAGTTRVAILPFTNKSGKSHYGAVGEMLSDKVIHFVLDDPVAMEFLEIVDRSELDRVLAEQELGTSGAVDDNTAVEVGKLLGVNKILTGQITQIISTEDPVNRRAYKEENDVIIRYDEVRNKEGEKTKKAVYGKVNANVNQYSQTARASISGSFKIIDVKTSRLLESESFEEGYEFSSQWGAYSGDKRALSSNSRNLVNTKRVNPPADEERVNEAGKKLVDRLAKEVITFFR